MENEEAYRERIRRIVERSQTKHRCPICGFDRFTGSVHAFAGVHRWPRDKTRWCHGKVDATNKTQSSDRLENSKLVEEVKDSTHE